MKRHIYLFLVLLLSNITTAFCDSTAKDNERVLKLFDDIAFELIRSGIEKHLATAQFHHETDNMLIGQYFYSFFPKDPTEITIIENRGEQSAGALFFALQEPDFIIEQDDDKIIESLTSPLIITVLIPKLYFCGEQGDVGIGDKIPTEDKAEAIMNAFQPCKNFELYKLIEYWLTDPDNLQKIREYTISDLIKQKKIL